MVKKKTHPHLYKKFLYFVVTELTVCFYFPFGQMVGNWISVYIGWPLIPTFTYSQLPLGLGLSLGWFTGCRDMGKASKRDSTTMAFMSHPCLSLASSHHLSL